jgi:hypothetical protein
MPWGTVFTPNSSTTTTSATAAMTKVPNSMINLNNAPVMGDDLPRTVVAGTGI